MDYDRSIHSNPDAQAWAEFFVKSCQESGQPCPDVELMTGWFANAMIAMHDSIGNQSQGDIQDQPPPQPNKSIPIADLVIADILERKQIGIERYGVPLQAGNGRDALVDAYQEALDLTKYLRQEIEERKYRVQPGQDPAKGLS